LDVLKLLCKCTLILKKLRECSIYLDEATEFCHHNEDISKNNVDYGLILEFYGDYNYYSDRFDEAIDYYGKALANYDRWNSPPENQANCYKQVANVYEVQQRYDAALDCIKRAIEYIENGNLVENREQI